MFARIFLSPRRNLRGQQIHNQTVFIRSPDGAVAPQETCARTLFPAEANRAVEKTRNEPLETYRCFPKPAAKSLHNAIDHLAADECLPDCGLSRPLRAVSKQILDGYRKIVIGIPQSSAGDNPVSFRIHFVGKSHLMLIL